MQPYEKQISSSVINLLKSCPADAVATRKELLVATRHILATDFRKGFFSEVRCRVSRAVCAVDVPGDGLVVVMTKYARRRSLKGKHPAVKGITVPH